MWVFYSLPAQIVLVFIASTISTEYPHILNQSDVCGKITDELVQGDIPVRFPWTIVFHIQDESTTDDARPALILGPSLVLIHASLFRMEWTKTLRFFQLNSYTVVAGVTDHFLLDFQSYPTQSSKVTHIRINPNYNFESWESAQHDLALLHLETPLEFNEFVRPICLQTDPDKMTSLKSPNGTNETLILTGWRRSTQHNIFLKFKIQEPEVCLHEWMNNNATSHAAYPPRICAFVGSENNHTNCIHRGVGSVRLYNGSYHFVGFTNNFYSDHKKRRTCTSKALYYFLPIQTKDLQWIEDNFRCGSSNFTCANGDCIPLTAICNKISDCSDNSDEDHAYCRGFKPCVDEFGCGTYGKCIPLSSVCDQHSDCEDGEDELDCPKDKRSTLVLACGLGGGTFVILTLSVMSALLWKKLKTAKEKLRNLTPEEVREFLTPAKGLEENQIGCPGQNTPYNTDFEIPAANLKIFWDLILGEGEFGIVYRGKLKMDNEIAESVAVKTLKADQGISDFKATLMELKVMIHVGEHKNILRLLGAYTAEIETRILYIVLELCPFGSLKNYLRNENNRLGPPDHDNGYQYVEFKYSSSQDQVYQASIVKPEENTVYLQQLMQWSHQIANGMSFLSSSNVTHGDLSTRNVLLDVNLTAKISDFGLARKLYATGVYLKKEMGPLPWPWMAPESLRRGEFSVQSDVWSFGITLWEIYSVGACPYGGLRWSRDFLDMLENGMRLNQPINATIETYKVMNDCWNILPSRRPCFEQLVQYFSS